MEEGSLEWKMYSLHLRTNILRLFTIKKIYSTDSFHILNNSMNDRMVNCNNYFYFICKRPLFVQQSKILIPSVNIWLLMAKQA